MTFRQSLLNVYELVGKRLFGIGVVENSFGSFQPWSGNGSQRANLATYKGLVWACVSVIAEAVGEYHPYLVPAGSGDQSKKITDHPFLTLLNNPQPNDKEGISKYDLFEATQSFKELLGECFWYCPKGKVSGGPLDIHVLRADKVGIDTDRNTGDVSGYYYLLNSGQKIPFEVNEIIHFKEFNPYNAYRGLGTVQAAMDYIQLDDHATNFQRRFFENNAALGGILTLKGQITKDAFAQIKRDFRQQYEGVDNVGKTALLRDVDANFQKLAVGLNELDMTALRGQTEDDVLRMFRMSKPLLGQSDDTGLGRGNVETLEYIFARRVVEPKLQRLDSTLQVMFNRFYPTEKLRVHHVNSIPEDKEFELTMWNQGVDRWVTRDEIRVKMGQTVAPGGDKLRTPFNSVPLDGPTLADNPKTTTPNPTQDSPPEQPKGITIKRMRRIKNSSYVDQRENVVGPIAVNVQDKLITLARGLKSDTKTLSERRKNEFVNDAKKVMVPAYGMAYESGAVDYNSEYEMDGEDQSNVSDNFDKQVPYLTGWALAIAAAETSDAQDEQRAGLYGRSVQPNYDQGYGAAFQDLNGDVTATWNTTGTDPCDECASRDGDSFTPDELPGYPGDPGLCQGGDNCQCYLEWTGTPNNGEGE